MPQDLPIACTLSGSELATRVDEWAQLGDDALIGIELGETRATLRFAGARDRLEELVEAERRCCAFFDLAIAADGEVMILDVSAPPAAAQVLREFAGAIAGDRLPA